MLSINLELSHEDFPELTPGQLSRLTRSVASRIRDAVKLATPIGNRGKPGTTRKAWTPVKRDEGGYSFENPLIQIKSLEYGSKIGKRPWPSVPDYRPRTVYNHGRVYSSQAPEGITTKADIQGVMDEVVEVLAKKLIKGESIAKR